MQKYFDFEEATQFLRNARMGGIGRNNWLFAGSLRAGKLGAA